MRERGKLYFTNNYEDDNAFQIGGKSEADSDTKQNKTTAE